VKQHINNFPNCEWTTAKLNIQMLPLSAGSKAKVPPSSSLIVWLVADGWWLWVVLICSKRKVLVSK
jgi:hypothetical protein